MDTKEGLDEIYPLLDRAQAVAVLTKPDLDSHACKQSR